MHINTMKDVGRRSRLAACKDSSHFNGSGGMSGITLTSPRRRKDKTESKGLMLDKSLEPFGPGIPTKEGVTSRGPVKNPRKKKKRGDYEV